MPCSKHSVSVARLKSDFLINTEREVFYDPIPYLHGGGVITPLKERGRGRNRDV